MKTNVLIIGAGIAGLNTACRIARLRQDVQITVLTKSSITACNSELAQGGIAVSLPGEDELEQHVMDTYIAGDQFGNTEVIRDILSDCSKMEDLFSWYNIDFDLDDQGHLNRIKEGGHSCNRIVHVNDTTGSSVMKAIRKKLYSFNNIEVLENHQVMKLRLQVNQNQCDGVEVYRKDRSDIITYYADVILLATGGIGSLYTASSNNPTSTGDGIALAASLGVPIENMEFIQFHPTALSQKDKLQLALITEALRGAGAQLVNSKLERFMSNYDLRMELAPRDIVARAIFEELKSGPVYLDCQHISKNTLDNNFPNFVQNCEHAGLNLPNDLIPIVPVQHYLCGGIKTNTLGETTISNLYACGECACTGLHGANRLASNSLLEALVVSERISDTVSKMSFDKDLNVTEEIIKCVESPDVHQKVEQLKTELRTIMQNEVGIVRTDLGLQKALQHIETLALVLDELRKGSSDTPETQSFLSELTVARMIIKSALFQNKNVGGHYNKDHVNTPSERRNNNGKYVDNII